MKVLISGCSYTEDSRPFRKRDFPYRLTWPHYLKQQRPDIEVTNVAAIAAGNQYIYESILWQLSQDHFDLVLVMWTGLSRFDIPIAKDCYDTYFHDYKYAAHIGNDVTYIFSGGMMGNWSQYPMAKSLFDSVYKLQNYSNLAVLSLQKIFMLQSILANSNIPYRFMSYANYWNTHHYPGDAIISSQQIQLNPKLQSPVISSIASAQSLVKQIDFNNWIWTGPDRKCLCEMIKDHPLEVSTYDDGFHPTAMISEKFVVEHLMPALHGIV
jgi:hypothetical protein